MAQLSDEAPPPPFKNYAGFIMAAPMVRVSIPAYRYMAARCGSDVVFSEEIVAAKLAKCTRETRPVPPHMLAESHGNAPPVGTGWNVPALDALRFPPGTEFVEFVRYEPFGKGTTKRAVAVATIRLPPEYRATRPWSEGKPFILQMGVADPDQGARAAALTNDDVDGFDVNMGCPKKFSVSNGMGAKLMEDVDRAAAILSAIRAAIGPSKPFSFKTRVFESVEDSVSQLTKCLATGAVHSVTLHARTRPQRSDTKPRLDLVQEVVKRMRQLFPDVAYIFNGSLGNSCLDNAGHIGRVDGQRWGGRAAMLAAVQALGFDGGLVARDAMWNPTVLLPAADADVTADREGRYYSNDYVAVHRRMLEYHAAFGTNIAFMKYHITRTFGQGPLQEANKTMYKALLQARSIREFAVAFGVEPNTADAWEAMHNAAVTIDDSLEVDGETSGAAVVVSAPSTDAAATAPAEALDGKRRPRDDGVLAADSAPPARPSPPAA